MVRRARRGARLPCDEAEIVAYSQECYLWRGWRRRWRAAQGPWIGSLLSQPQRPQRKRRLDALSACSKPHEGALRFDRRRSEARRLQAALIGLVIARVGAAQEAKLEEFTPCSCGARAGRAAGGGSARASTCLRTGTTCIGVKRAAPLAPAASHACANKASGTRLADGPRHLATRALPRGSASCSAGPL